MQAKVSEAPLMVLRHDVFAHLCRTDFRTFVDFVFRELHPGEALIARWYLDLIADRIEAVAKGRAKRLILNAPPRTLKSLIATIALAAFVIGRDPTRRILLIAGHQALASELMMRLRALMASDRYRSLFPNMRLQMAGTTIRTAYGGGIRSAIVGQQLSGHGADLVIIDDPLSPSHAQDDDVRLQVNKWCDAEVMQRLNSRSDSALVLVMQRVHSGDLAGHLHSRDEFEAVILPSVATDDEDWLLADGRRFSRRRGDALDPDGDSLEQQLHLYQQVGEYVYATQYLQNTCGSKDEPARMRWAPKPPGWSPGDGIRGGFYRTTVHSYIRHYAFGHPLPEHYNWGYKSPLTEEETRATIIISQARLIAKCQREWTDHAPTPAH